MTRSRMSRRHVHLLLTQYMRGLVLLTAIAFLLEFIRIPGSLVATISSLMAAGLSGFQHLLWILIFLAVFHVLQDYLLTPGLLE